MAMYKRIISLLLAVVLAAGLLPVGGFAAEAEVVDEIISLPELSLSHGAEQSLDAQGKVPLKEGNYVNWIDRLDLSGALDDEGENYALRFSKWLAAGTSKNGALVDPEKAFDSALSKITKIISQGKVYYTYKITQSTGCTTQEELTAEKDAVVAYTMAVFQAFDRDHPEVFWLTGQSNILTRTIQSGSSYTQEFYFLLCGGGFDIRDPRFQNANILEGDQILMKDDIAFALSQVSGNRYEQVKGINEYLTITNAYNESPDTAGAEARECISALKGQTGADGPVCEGYARAFKVLCDELEIPCVLVDGMAVNSMGEARAHMWNYVQMDNGKWYGVDVTWNDPVIPEAITAESFYETEDYLLVGADTVINGMTFLASHPVANLVAENGTAFTNGPVLENQAYDPSDPACDHSSAVYTASGATMEARCPNCGISDSLTLVAKDVVYDGEFHMVGTISPSTLMAPVMGSLCYYSGGEPCQGTPRRPGTYTAEITAGDQKAQVTYTIGKRPLTPYLKGSAAKLYDGTTAVPNNHSLVIDLPGIVYSESVSATADFAYDSAQVGIGISVTATGITLQGEDSGNYVLKTDTASANVGRILENINPGLQETFRMNTVTATVKTPGLQIRTSTNRDKNTYKNYADDPVTSVLRAENGGFVRAEYIGGEVVVEWYDSGYGLLKQKKIPLELPLYGGIYMDDEYNFIVCGDYNDEECWDKEVVRVIRYNKDWEKEATGSLLGANTTIPFDSGSLRFARSGNYLYLRSGHQMFASKSDGLNHQANMMLNLRISDMEFVDMVTAAVGVTFGAVSHSFNQFVQTDGNLLVGLDHGDAYPRAVVLISYGGTAGEERMGPFCTYENVLEIAENVGHYNTTGVNVGGFELSDTHYLVAGNSCDQSGGIEQGDAQRNIFVTSTAKGRLGRKETTIQWLTAYTSDSNVELSNPHLVKTGDNSFCLMWTAEDILYYCMLDGKGEMTSDVNIATGSLSDCKPIVSDGKIRWYVTDRGTPVFYEIELTPHTHSYSDWSVTREPGCEEPGSRSRSCSCGAAQTEEVPATGHTEVADAAWEADCTTSGKTEGMHCSACGTILTEQTEIPPLGHSYENDVCTRCGHDRSTPAGTVVRIAGAGRCETARAVADALKQEMGAEKFNAILYTSGLNFADALAGSYLSAVKKAPILLYWKNGTNVQDNLNYMQENLAPGGTVYILGGYNAVPETVDAELAAQGIASQRVSGSNRYLTNLEILKASGFSGGRVLVCTAMNFADSLSASATGLPILLVYSGWTELSREQKEYLAGFENLEFIIVGGNSAVHPELEASLEAYGTVERLAGTTRFETSTMVARKFFENPDEAVLAYAMNFPDGLCGGALAYAKNAPLILTKTDATTAAESYVQEKNIHSGAVLGSDNLIDDASVEKIFNISRGAEKTFTVQFEVNGGNAVKSQTVAEGQQVSEPAAPSRSGYVFSGWYVDKNLTVKYDFSEHIQGDKILYAAWEKETSKILRELTADQTYLVAQEESVVTFQVTVSEAPNTISLYCGEKQVAVMSDNGLDGDSKAGDGIFSCTVKLNPAEAGSETYAAGSDTERSNEVTLYYFARPTEAEAQAARKIFEETNRNIQAIEAKYAEDTGYADPDNFDDIMVEVAAYLTELKTQNAIVQYAIEDNNVYIKFASGVALLYHPALEGVATGGDTVTLTVWSYEPQQDFYTNANGIVLFEVPDRVRTAASALGSTATSYRTEEVTRERIKAFGPNQVIFWSGHGYYGPIVKSSLLTGEYWDWNQWRELGEYYHDAISNRITSASTKHQNDLLCVTSKYFQYYSGNLSGSFFLLSSCYSGKNGKLANALLNKGAVAVLGYSDEVYIDYCDRVSMTVLSNMHQMNPDTNKWHTFEEALDISIATFGESDIAYKMEAEGRARDDLKDPVASPLIFGDADYRLKTTHLVTGITQTGNYRTGQERYRYRQNGAISQIAGSYQNYSNVWNYEYNAKLQLTDISQHALNFGVPTTYRYNELGWITEYITTEGSKHTLSYDDQGLLKRDQGTDGYNNWVTDYQYNKVKRLVQECYKSLDENSNPRYSYIWDYEYDSNGKLESAVYTCNGERTLWRYHYDYAPFIIRMNDKHVWEFTLKDGVGRTIWSASFLNPQLSVNEQGQITKILGQESTSHMTSCEITYANDKPEEPQTTAEKYEEFLLFRDFSDDWNKLGVGTNYTADQYALVDIDQDGTEELIVQGSDKRSPGFFGFLVYGIDEDTGDICRISVGRPGTEDKVIQFYGSLSYSDAYDALVFSEFRTGGAYGGLEFFAMQDQKILSIGMVSFENDTDTMRCYSSLSGTRVEITEAEHRALLNEVQGITFTKLP